MIDQQQIEDYNICKESIRIKAKNINLPEEFAEKGDKTLLQYYIDVFSNPNAKKLQTISNMHLDLHFDGIPMILYCRFGMKYIASKFIFCMQLGQIGVDKKERNKGHFSKFLKSLEMTADQLKFGIFIENIQTKRFARFIENKCGYTKCENCHDDCVPSFYRLIKM